LEPERLATPDFGFILGLVLCLEMAPPLIQSVLTVQFSVLSPVSTHPDSITFDRDDPNRAPIPLAAQLDFKRPPKYVNGKPKSTGIVVVCHGLLDNRHKPLVSYLRSVMPWDVATMDFRGCGESGGETGFSQHGKDADSIAALVEHLEREFGPVKCVIGHSAGGASVNIWAARYPAQSSRVGRLITVNALFYNGVPPLDAFPPDPLNLGRITEFPFEFAVFRRGPQGARNEQVRCLAYKEDLEYRNNYLPMSNHLPKVPLGVSVLAILGDKDSLMDVRRDAPLWRKFWNEENRDLRVEVLEGCEHLYVDPGQQEKLGAVVLGWLGARWTDEESVVMDEDRGEQAEAKL